MVATKCDEEFVNEGLCMAATCAFANVDSFCMFGNERHDLIGNQTVVNDNLGRCNEAMCFNGK
jgi:hypothetical protein